MINADLEAVNRRYAGKTHPLRNRSASSSSGDGSQMRPDPNRYTKYLSLRNRKIVEHQFRRGVYEDSASSEERNQGDEEPHRHYAQQPATSVAEVEKPLQSCIKTTSSQRYAQSGGHNISMEKSSSRERHPVSVEEVIHQNQYAVSQQLHSPLRSKSPSIERQKDDANLMRGVEEKEHVKHQHSHSRSSLKRSPIPIFKPTAEIEHEDRRHEEMKIQQDKSFESKQNSIGSRKRNCARNSSNQHFKSRTEDSEINFDFDNEISRSYINTTEKTDRESIKTHTVAAFSQNQPAFYQPNSLAMAHQRLANDRDLQKHSLNSQPVSQPNMPMEDYQSDDKESTDYVIDYEQVLKDNSEAFNRSVKQHGTDNVNLYSNEASDRIQRDAVQKLSPTRFRDEIGQTTILEQTQEAQETSSDREVSESDLIEAENILLLPHEKTVEHEHPKFQGQAEIQEITRRKGFQDDPLINSGTDFRKNSNILRKNHDYNEGKKTSVQRVEPQTALNTYSRQATQSHTETEAAALSAYKRVMSPERHFRQSSHSKKSAGDRTITSGNTRLKGNFYGETLMQDSIEEAQDCLTPLLENSQTEYDMTESNRKIRKGNLELNQEYEKQCYGSQAKNSQLIVTCIIRQLPDSSSNASRFKSIHGRQQLSSGGLTNQRTNHFLSGDCNAFDNAKGSRGNSQDPYMKRNGSLLGRSVLDMSKQSSYSCNRSARRRRATSHELRDNRSGGGVVNRMNPGAMGQIPNAYRHPHILTTTRPSKFVLRSPTGLQAQLLSILLRSEQDINHCEIAFDEHGMQSKMKGHRGMKVFEFDNCIGETKGHSLTLGLEQNLRWINQTQSKINYSQQQKGSVVTPKSVIFMFGQTDALKSQLLNINQSNSVINQCINMRDVRFMRVSTYHLGQEYLLAHKSFNSKQQLKREIGLEIREAFRERDLNAKKIALRLSSYSKTIKAEEVKSASHLFIQVDDLVIIDLADIDNLKDSSMAKKISADFAAVTNAILAMSSFYKDHDFGKVDEDRFAPYRELTSLRAGSLSFKNQISRLVHRKSRVLLLCCVTQCSVAGTQAVDYCHKIRSYFHGSAADDETTPNPVPSRRMQRAQGDISMETDQNVNAFRQLGGLISEVSKARTFIDKVFANKQRGEPLKRNRNQLKEMVTCLRDDVSELLNSLAVQNEGYIHELRKIREIIQLEIDYMRDKVNAMRSLGRKNNNSIGGSSRKSGHTLCLLPKTSILTAQQQHQQQALLAKQRSISKQSSSGFLHNQRPSSRSQLHQDCNSGGARPQSSRNTKNNNQHAFFTRTMKQRMNQQSQQQNLHESRTSRSQTKSHSLKRHGITSKTALGNNHFTPVRQQILKLNQEQSVNSTKPMITPVSHQQLFEHPETVFSAQKTSSNKRQSSHKSLTNGNSKNDSNPAFLYNGVERTQSSAQSQRLYHQHNQLDRSQNHSAVSRNVGRSTADDITGVNNGSVLLGGRTLTQNTSTNDNRKQQQSESMNFKRGKIASKNVSDVSVPTAGHQQVEATSGERKRARDSSSRTRHSVNLSCQNRDSLVSGGRASLPSNLESTLPLAKVEGLHQEIFELKNQLRTAIMFGEEQSEKRKKAEESCICLTHSLSQKGKEYRQLETKVADFENRIDSKDKIIQSLESQVEFLKDKFEQRQRQPPQLNQKPTSATTQASKVPATSNELEALREEKNQTDLMNKEILGQISMLKEALAAFQSQERANEILLKQQMAKDREMDELKDQVKQLIEINMAPKPQPFDERMKQRLQPNLMPTQPMRLDEPEQAKDRYREEALQPRSQTRQRQRAPSGDNPNSKERSRSTVSSNRRKVSQDREPLRLHKKIAGNNNQSTIVQGQILRQFNHPATDQKQILTDRHHETFNSAAALPQQKSLNSIKSMIRDFKEQRKSLLRTTSSREALNQASKAAASSRQHQSSQGMVRNRSNRSRENEDREPVRHRPNTGYAHLNSHFR